jgi:predicted nucleotidyltransferase
METQDRMPRPPRSLLGDTTMLRVAGILYLDPSSARSLGELTRALPDINRLTVIRALKDLGEAGYILKTAGNPPTYRANARHYLFDEMRSIAVKTLGGFENLARRIVDAPSIKYAAVYGSFARKTAGSTSDIDLLLVVSSASDPAVAEIVSDLAGAAHALGREINPTIYDEHEFDAKRESGFLHEVLTGPLIVLRGT